MRERGSKHDNAIPRAALAPSLPMRERGSKRPMKRIDDGDLKAGLDFRSVYASLLGSVLGGEPGGVLDGWEQRVDGLFA